MCDLKSCDIIFTAQNDHLLSTKQATFYSKKHLDQIKSMVVSFHHNILINNKHSDMWQASLLLTISQVSHLLQYYVRAFSQILKYMELRGQENCIFDSRGFSNNLISRIQESSISTLVLLSGRGSALGTFNTTTTIVKVSSHKGWFSTSTVPIGVVALRTDAMLTHSATLDTVWNEGGMLG